MNISEVTKTYPAMDAAYAGEVYDRILPMIESDCRPFLQQIDNEWEIYKLYRGMKAKPGHPIQRKEVRLTNRTPHATDELRHERFNDFFSRKFGYPFRNSVFATGDSMDAAVYGNGIHVIFPIGDFDFLWSPYVRDMTYDLKWEPIGGFSHVPPSQDLVDKTLNNVEYQVTDFKGAIISGKEIMIRCKEYYAVDWRVFTSR